MVDMTPSAEMILLIALTCVILAPLVLLLAIQYTALQSVNSEARTLHPAAVWLQLIPVFGHVWQFIVIYRIADSLHREIEWRLAGSFLSADDFNEMFAIDKRPTRGTGNIFGILNCVMTVLIILSAIYPEKVAGALSAPLLILGVVTLVFFITYLAQLVAAKRLIIRSAR